MSSRTHGPNRPPLDPESVIKALRATLPKEEADEILAPFEEGSGWFALSPGLDPIKLAIAVVSSEFADWLRGSPLSREEVESIDRIRELPEGRALEEIRQGLWDPPYGDT